MAKNQDKTKNDIYNYLKSNGYEPVLKSTNGKEVSVPDEAEVIEFQFNVDGESYGTAAVSLDNEGQMKVFYSDKIRNSPSKSENGEITWNKLIPALRQMTFGKTKSFELDDMDNLEYDMAKREHSKKLEEGYYPMGKKASYSDNIPECKIIIKHNRTIEEGEQRYRNIHQIFIENQLGERFLAPTVKPGLARVYARHIAEGGKVNDDKWNHITGLCEEYSKMAGFIRATRNGQFNEDTQRLVTAGTEHYMSLRESLHKLAGKRGYNNYFESWAPPLMESEGDEDLSEMFVNSSLDPRIESVIPILNRLNKTISENQEIKEVVELEEWADDIAEGIFSHDIERAFPGGKASGVKSHPMKTAVIKTNKPIGTRVADIGKGGKEHNVRTDREWDKQKGVAEGKEELHTQLQSINQKLKLMRGGPVGEPNSMAFVEKRKELLKQKEQILSQLKQGVAEGYEPPTSAKGSPAYRASLLRKKQERQAAADAKKKQQGVAEAVWDRPSQSYVPRDGRTFGQTNHPREEHCDACGAATGHAGPGEDSNVDDEGNVYCDDCYADQKGVAEGLEDTVKQKAKQFGKYMTEPDTPQQAVIRARAKNIDKIRKNKEKGVAEAAPSTELQDKMRQVRPKGKGITRTELQNAMRRKGKKQWHCPECATYDDNVHGKFCSKYKPKEQGVAEGFFGIDDKIKGKIQNVVSDLSDIPGMWDHKAQTFTDAGMDKLKTVLKNNPKYIKYALNLDYRDYEAEGVAEGHADQQRKIFKKNGHPVGEVGIDRESSPGNGQWYMKCYAYDIDNSGYDSYEEAVAELKHCMKQGVAEGRPEDLPGIDYDRPGDIKIKQRPHMAPQRPRHPDDPDFMDPDQRRLRADQARVKKAQDEYHAKKNQGGLEEDIGPQQAAVGQLGATAKVNAGGTILGNPERSQKGLRGKLVGGATESVDPLISMLRLIK